MRKRLFRRVAAAALCLPAAAFAHGGERGLVMLLPTGHYQAGAAIAVAATFALLLCLPARRFAADSRELMRIRATPPRWPSMLSCCLLWLLLSAGYFGATDPLANPLPLSVWTLWWIGFTMAQCALGNLWPLLNPWSGPLAVIERVLPARAAPLRRLRALRFAPACVLFLAFAWFELIDPAPDNPARLANAALAYWCFTLLACLLCGERYWLRYAEPFSVFFRLAGRCAPLMREALRGRGESKLALKLGLPGAQYPALAPLPASGVVFVLLTLSAVSFDGLNKTFAWLAFIGVNPLAYPGRSAVLAANTAGLLLAFAALASAFFLCVWLGCRLARRAEMFPQACGRLVYSLIPVALAFHFAHYLSAFAVGGQYALLAFNDPFGLGWNLLGANEYRVTTSFLTHYQSVAVVWNVQTAALVLGHITGIGVCHFIAVRLFASAAAASQIFPAALMVFYTVFGLWLLSAPAIG